MQSTKLVVVTEIKYYLWNQCDMALNSITKGSILITILPLVCVIKNSSTYAMRTEMMANHRFTKYLSCHPMTCLLHVRWLDISFVVSSCDISFLCQMIDIHNLLLSSYDSSFCQVIKAWHVSLQILAYDNRLLSNES